MQLAHSRLARLVVLLATLSLVVSACGNGGEGNESADGSANGGSGTVNVSGSSTVAPISTRVAEYFEDIEPDILVNVDGPGTGDGFQLFCAGETDISDASRPIKAAEAEACEENDVTFIELKVAIDGLSVLVHPDNDIECLSFADMYALAGPESQGFGGWSDAADLAAELGSSTEFPDLDLSITAPGEESGTYDSFVEIVIESIAEEREANAETRPDYQSSADDNVIIQGIQGATGSFGWVGYAYAVEAGDSVRQVPVSAEPGGECVAPTEETVADNTYPIARDLYIYVNVDKLDQNAAVESYVDFYLTDDGLEAVSEVGYVDLAADAIEATRQVWEARQTGTRDGG